MPAKLQTNLLDLLNLLYMLYTVEFSAYTGTSPVGLALLFLQQN